MISSRDLLDDSIFFHSGLKELAANGWPQAKAEKPAEKTTKKATEKTAKKATEKDTEKGAEKVQPAPKASKIVQDGDCCLKSVSVSTIVRSP